MKFIREMYGILKQEDYFDNNTTIYVNLDNREHNKLIDSLIMCPDNYRKFMIAFLSIKEAIGNDDNMYSSVRKTVLQLTEYNLADKSKRIKHSHYVYICYILLYALYDSDMFKDYSDLISQDNRYILDTLFDSELSVQKTCKRLISYMGVDNSKFSDTFNVFNILGSNLELVFGILYPEILFDDELSWEITKANKILYNESISLATSINTPVNHIVSLDSIYTTHYFRISDNDNYKPIVREGFLKSNSRSGSLSLDGTDDPRTNFKYMIKEIVRKTGVSVYYLVYNKDFKLSILEDPSNDIIITNISFFDEPNNENTDETIFKTTGLLMYLVKEQYLIKLSKSEHHSNSISGVQYTKRTNKDDSRYIKKVLMISPFKRKLAPNQSASEDSLNDAKLFGFKLEDGETFVNSFIREQRYLNDDI